LSLVLLLDLTPLRKQGVFKQAFSLGERFGSGLRDRLPACDLSYRSVIQHSMRVNN
jgi:hypothetical protein